MNKIKITALLFFAVFLTKAQTNPSEFSLQGAIDYAIKNSSLTANAEVDALSAKYKKNEIVGLGLPQISGSADAKDYLKVPVVGLGSFAPGTPMTPLRFGLQYAVTPSISASQLLFSSDYIIGVKAAKQLLLLSEKSTLRTKSEVALSISKAYYMALVNRERIKLLDANVVRLKKLLDDTRAYNQQGFVEKIDVDRLEVTYNNLMTEKEKTERLVLLSETLLKFQMGYKMTDPIVLTDKLDAEQQSALALGDKINYENRPEYSLMQTQRILNELDVKRNKMAYLPTLVGYANVGYNGYNSKFDFWSSKNVTPLGNLYSYGIVGATLNIPIFDGLQKHWKIQQAKMALVKTNNTAKSLESLIEFEVQSASVQYQNAQSSVEAQKKNMALAQNIFDVSEKKYQQGVGSNIEIVNAQTSLKEAQTNYYNALYDLLVAKIDYQKATGTLVK